ncbi:hypothetical protein PMIN01_11994 [Paraphaeosphaeria minitans]|uniref:Uncharacterized protein n=1 Tax=Paraphaeosphaeria minitans TaxID=565426 RepID=A0A9P6KKX5_9PLEO|nr:hypothetical protein PMIN01_11994 [Paraphaeosphaeria minitans]
MTSLEQADLEAALRLIGEASPHYLATLSEELLHNVRLKIACTLATNESACGDKHNRTTQHNSDQRPESLQTWFNKVEKTIGEHVEAKRKATAATIRNLGIVKKHYSDTVLNDYLQWKKSADPSLVESWQGPGKGKRKSHDAVSAFCKQRGSTSSSKSRENLCIHSIVEDPTLNHMSLLIGYNWKDFLKHRLGGDFTDEHLQHEDLHRLAERVRSIVSPYPDDYLFLESGRPKRKRLHMEESTRKSSKKNPTVDPTRNLEYLTSQYIPVYQGENPYPQYTIDPTLCLDHDQSYQVNVNPFSGTSEMSGFPGTNEVQHFPSMGDLPVQPPPHTLMDYFMFPSQT